MSWLRRHYGKSSSATRGCTGGCARQAAGAKGAFSLVMRCSGGVGQGPGKGEHLAHGLFAIGRLADPEREVVGGDRPDIAVIGLAALVPAVCRLEFHVGEYVPAD